MLCTVKGLTRVNAHIFSVALGIKHLKLSFLNKPFQFLLMKFAQFEKIIGEILPYNTYNISQIPTCLSLGMTAVVFNLFFNISNY